MSREAALGMYYPGVGMLRVPAHSRKKIQDTKCYNEEQGAEVDTPLCHRDGFYFLHDRGFGGYDLPELMIDEGQK